MTRSQACKLCGHPYATDSICVQCQAGIKAGTRIGNRVKRNDCPLHPGKTINCQVLGIIDGWSITKSKVCKRHKENLVHQETADFLSLLERIENRPTKVPREIR